METIRGKRSFQLDYGALQSDARGFDRIALDLGTGDRRYVRYLAAQHPEWFVIGIDTCRENLREQSRVPLANALFIITGAERLPAELRGMARGLTINFPWGSLLRGLLVPDPSLMSALASAAGPSASLELRLNAGALAEAGVPLQAGAARIWENLLRHGWCLSRPSPVSALALKAFPSTWARRVAHGRDPRAMLISGHFV